MSQPSLIAAGICLADQLTKLWVVRRFLPGESLPLIDPIARLTYVQNTGAAFGLFKGRQVLFILFSCVVIAWIVREFLARRAPEGLTAWSYALVLGGAAGNLLDRVRLGYVVDFIDLRVWPVFNIGDSAITIGVTLLVWHSLFGHRRHPPGDASRTCTPSS